MERAEHDGGGEGVEDSFSLARWQLVPSVLGTLSGAAVSVVILGVLLLLTLLFGRVYCSFICPLGILQDIVFRIRRWLAPKRFLKFSRPVPWMRYGVLALLAACCVMGLAGLSLNWLDPYSIFGRIMYVLAWPAAIWSNNLLAADSSSADLVQMDYFPAAFPVLLASAGHARPGGRHERLEGAPVLQYGMPRRHVPWVAFPYLPFPAGL